MKKITTISFIIFIGVFIVLAIVFLPKNKSVKDQTPVIQPVVQVDKTQPVVKQVPVIDNKKPSSQLTALEVAKHNTQSSCWTIVSSYVYDLTTYVSQHPGGSQQILNMCGIDASSSFDNQHSGQRRPANELAGFKLGALVK